MCLEHMPPPLAVSGGHAFPMVTWSCTSFDFFCKSEWSSVPVTGQELLLKGTSPVVGWFHQSWAMEKVSSPSLCSSFRNPLVPLCCLFSLAGQMQVKPRSCHHHVMIFPKPGDHMIGLFPFSVVPQKPWGQSDAHPCRASLLFGVRWSLA